jgi:FkbM family methyltransferase
MLPLSTAKFISALQWRIPAFRRIYLALGRAVLKVDHTVRSGPSKGLRFNAGRARNFGFVLGTYEPEVQKLYAELLCEGMTVYDVGANVGFLSVLAARLVGPTGSVVCFEPLLDNVNAIMYNAAINRFRNITIVQEALANCDKVSNFMVSEDVGWGRLEGHNLPAEVSARIEVRCRTLDSAIREHRLRAPDIIKMDIEGGEVGALEGAESVLKEYGPTLLIELHGTNRDVDAILARNGYRSYVVGEKCSIVESRWDAFIVAVPEAHGKRCEDAFELAAAASFAR